MLRKGNKLSCFICKKGLGFLSKKYHRIDLVSNFPDMMSDEDVLCKKCFKTERKRIKKLIKEQKKEEKLKKKLEKKSLQVCMICEINEPIAEFKNGNMCAQCYIDKFGKPILTAKNGEYYGGHKSYLAGGFFSDFVIGSMYLTPTHFIFLRGNENHSERIEIVIPLKSMIIQNWTVKENERRISTTGGGVGGMEYPLGGGIFTATSNKQGKSHRLVIPYVDENGIPQEPVFGISSFGGKKIKEWASNLYELIVQNREEIKSKPPEILEEEKTDDPVKILKIRYAKGEITKKEFEQMKNDLEHS